MPDDAFSDAALVLVGHGSTTNATSSAATQQHAAELRQRQLFADVRACFLKQEPFLAATLARLHTPRTFVVPMFISEGYFTNQVIPGELGLVPEGRRTFDRVRHLDSRTLFYAAPIGTHPKMTDLLLARADAVAAQFPFPRRPRPAETALFVVGHGTERDANSRRAVERQVESIRRRGLFAETQAVFLEEEPRVGDCYRLAFSQNLILVPFFVSDGMHSVEDIPVLLGEPASAVAQRVQRGLPTWRNPTERHGKLVWYTPSIGSEPLLTEIILERVREVAALDRVRG